MSFFLIFLELFRCNVADIPICNTLCAIKNHLCATTGSLPCIKLAILCFHYFLMVRNSIRLMFIVNPCFVTITSNCNCPWLNKKNIFSNCLAVRFCIHFLSCVNSASEIISLHFDTFALPVTVTCQPNVLYLWPTLFQTFFFYLHLRFVSLNTLLDPLTFPNSLKKICITENRILCKPLLNLLFLHYSQPASYPIWQ